MTSNRTNDINDLLNKYLEKKCTEHEKQRLQEMLVSPVYERQVKEVLMSLLHDFREEQYENETTDFERLYTRILSEIQHRETTDYRKPLAGNKTRVRRLIAQGLSMAAVFCIAFILGTAVHRDRTAITAEHSDTNTYIEVTAPLGARSEVKLADGTEVMLNAGSTIKYRSDYNSLHRDLHLEGEAYFKVAKRHDLPLVVSAGNIRIKATGTEFNVKAYSDDGMIETTLVEGKIEITQEGSVNKEETLQLKPSQKAIYTSESNRITLEEIRETEPKTLEPAKIITDKLVLLPATDVDQVTAWTHNKLIIRNENLENLCIKLQRKYNVTFTFGDEEVKKHRFTGVLLDETLQQVLDVIKITAPIDYSLNRKNVLLYTKMHQQE